MSRVVHGVGRFIDHFNSITPDDNGCMIWPLSKRGRYGYGQAACFDGVHPAHRVSAHLFLGLDLADSTTCALHRCDIPPCVNPAHLFLGTVTDNDADRDAKGRTARGNDFGRRVKLTPAAVLDIRQRLDEGETLVSIARRYNVTPGAIRFVRDGTTWSHVQSGTITCA